MNENEQKKEARKKKFDGRIFEQQEKKTVEMMHPS